MASALALGSLVACGGGELEVYNADSPQPGEGSPRASDAASDPDETVVDMGAAPDTSGNEVPVDLDMGSDETPDMSTIDMEMADPAPTTNVPQQGPTVGSQVTTSCSTISVKGLSLQLIDQMNCLDPGVMKSFEGAPGISYGGAVFPFQQGPATDTLTAVAANNAGTMPINSALRTVPQQYLLYEWYQRGLCNANLAASPGRSNHNGGLAVDIGDSNTWRTVMRNESYIDNVSGEPWHFYFNGAGGKDVRSLSVLAFQQLHNYNFPENPIDEDGVYGPQTERALVASPADGFTVQPLCQATMALIAYPHRTPLDVEWDLLGAGFLGIRTFAPNGIRLVEYYVDDVLVGYADHDARQFETVLELPDELDDVAAIDIVAYDHHGAERGRVRGAVQSRWDSPVFVRPVGGGNYEIRVEALPNNVQHIDFFIDGIPVEQEAWLAISEDKHRLATQLRGEVELGVVMLDRKGRVVDMRVVDLSL